MCSPPTSSSILRLLPVVPRIRTIARLNKRWCELAYRSIDSFTDLSVDWGRSTCAKALARLPSLTRLDIIAPLAPVRLPATLRHLSVRVNRTLKLTEPLPSQLSSLSLHTVQADVAPLLASLGSTLRSLRLRTQGISIELGSFLNSAYLPSLTALSLEMNSTNADELTAFYARHATQLLELTVLTVSPHFLRTIDTHSLPSLRTLNWHLPLGRPSETRVLESVLPHCPRLTSLHAPYVPEPVPIAVFALRSLSLSHGNLVSVNREKLPLFTRLSSLSIEELTTFAIQLLGERVTLVTSCDFAATTDTSTPLQPLHSMPLLQRLRLTVRCPPETLLPIPPLTNLTKLTLSGSSFSEQMQTALQFARVCPALRIVNLVHGLELRPISHDFLLELDQRGVERLKIPIAPSEEVQLNWLTVVVDRFALLFS